LPYAAFGAQNKEPISFSTYGSRFSAYAFTYTTALSDDRESEK